MAKAHTESATIQAVHGIVLLDCGEFEKAKVQFDRSLSLEKNAHEAHLGLGELAYGWFHLEEALHHCLHAMNKHARARDVLIS